MFVLNCVAPSDERSFLHTISGAIAWLRNILECLCYSSVPAVYPHEDAYMGNFTANIRDMHEDYIRPQENGSHFGCRHMTVSDGRINLRFTAENDFSFNASEYTEEELAAKRHNFELQKCESNVICVDSQMAGVGSNSCGPALAEKYRLSLPNISAKLHMEILG